MKSLHVIIFVLVIIAIAEFWYICVLTEQLHTQQAAKSDNVSQPAIAPSQKSVSTAGRPIEVGQPLPELEFVCIKGRTYKVREYKDHVVVIDFWATWCGPCRASTPYLLETYERYKDKGLVIFGISLDDDKSALLDYLEENHIPWPQYYDGLRWNNKLWRKLCNGGIPQIVVIDRDGIVRASDIRVAELPGMVAKLLGEEYSSSSQTAKLSEANVEQPFHERINAVTWDGKRYAMTFAGEQRIKETQLGHIDKWVDGLAFAPDGRIAFSYGNGTTPDMMLAYWSPAGIGNSVADLRYLRNLKSEDRDALEKEGNFWFFSGPLAFGADGTCYFSLGPCSPNGLYKVISNSPVKIEKLYTADSTQSLQIPSFDTQRLYSGDHKGIFRYSITAEGTKDKEPWFAIVGYRGCIANYLIINPNQVIAEVVFSPGNKISNNDYCVKSLLFDKEQGCFRVLPFEDRGAMAVSRDGKTMIRFNGGNQSISEFTLENNGESTEKK